MRLLRALALFQATPPGMTTRELADRPGVRHRTPQRDLAHHQAEPRNPLVHEQNPSGHSCYLMAGDPKRDAPRSYKLERISAVRVFDERFDPPLGFSVGKHLAHAWGVWTSERPVPVELRFSPDVARRVKETTWHESQQAEDLADGSVR